MATETSDEDFERAQQAVLDRFGTKATSRRVRIDEPSMNVHLLEVGEGKPVLVVHGGGAMAVQMEPLLGRLGAHFRVLAPDHPGCGLSDPIDYTGVDFRAAGVNFLRSTLDALSVDRASIVAFSIAGLWTLSLAMDHPDRVDKIALVGAPGGLGSDMPLPMRMATVPVLGDLMLATVMQPSPKNTRRMFDQFASRPDRVPREILDASAVSSMLPGSFTAFKTMLKNITTPKGFRSQYVLDSQLSKISHPVLLVWGSDDAVNPPSVGERAVRDLPDGRLEVIEGANHMVWLDAPDETTRLLIDFLG